MRLRLVFLVSGSGTLLQAVIDAVAANELKADIVAVGSDAPDAYGLSRAQAAGIPTFCVPMPRLARRGTPERLAWDQELADAVDRFEPDLVVSAGFMKLFDAAFLERFRGRIINTHPALLPAFPGAHAVRDALAAGATTTGASIFWVDQGVDDGALIAQRAVSVEPDDTEESLHERIKIVERALLVDTLRSLATKEARMSERIPVRRALVSVYDKTGLEDLGRMLADAGVEIVSTGSTAKQLAAAGIAVTPVEDITQFPECFDDRVKTLHPKIHGGLLADRRLETHRAQLDELGIQPFDLLISNLYPFSETVASGAGIEDCIAKIDIGGPAMVRAAAKNHASVAVITSPDQYDGLREALANGGYTMEQRQRLAADAFQHTAAYDMAVASWMGTTVTGDDEAKAGFPRWLPSGYTRRSTLRYGENSHQPAALYVTDPEQPASLACAEQLGGKEMSYNNYVDTDAARRAAYDFAVPAVAIIKHSNPCGIATGADVAEAHRKAHACDSVSAYGGVIATNRPVTLEMARQVKPIFTEVIVAPDYEPEALALLQTKKNLRILKAGERGQSGTDLRAIDGGMLVQEHDHFQAEGDDPTTWTLVSGEAADAATLADLAFAWKACRSVKSNAILLAHDGASVGVGMGQVNRVDSARLAVQRAGERAAGSVAASDAFFPFADGAEILIDGGVRAIVQPGGSIRDEEVIKAAQDAGVTMYLTGVRHFFH